LTRRTSRWLLGWFTGWLIGGKSSRGYRRPSSRPRERLTTRLATRLRTGKVHQHSSTNRTVITEINRPRVIVHPQTERMVHCRQSRNNLSVRREGKGIQTTRTTEQSRNHSILAIHFPNDSIPTIGNINISQGISFHVLRETNIRRYREFVLSVIRTTARARARESGNNSTATHHSNH
jgi:hypothetical protein